MGMTQSADIAVVTNLAPNHLDVHKDMAEYIAAKENVYLHQGKTGKLVVNMDNEITNSFAEKAPGTVEKFSRLGKTFERRLAGKRHHLPQWAKNHAGGRY